MDPRAHLFGIRHHGPGSAASLVAALDALDPALVLIEGAPEAEPLAGYAALAGMQPPLAILHYQADDPANAIFAPFAEYSPEWQAMRWALARGRGIRFIDWPAAHALAFGQTQQEALPGDKGEGEVDDPEQAPPPAYADPLDNLASIAGYSDGEAWWNAMVESSQPGPAMFAAIEAAITELRNASEAGGGLSPWREARDRVREPLETRRVLKAFAVFNADQCDCLPAMYYPEPVIGLIEPVGREERLDEFFAKIGASLRHQGCEAYYEPAADRIPFWTNPRTFSFRVWSYSLLCATGCIGFVGRRSIAEGKNREAGLSELITAKATIYNAITNIVCPAANAAVAGRPSFVP